MTDSIKQYLIIFVIFVVSIGGLYAIKPQPPIKPCGMILPAEKIFPATKTSEVKHFPQLTYAMQDLGNISVRQRAKPNETTPPQSMFDYATKLAASVGANGIVWFVGKKPMQSLETGAVWYMFGKAVRVG